MTRDILDTTGAKIGELTLDDATTEDQWTAALAVYTYTPPVPTLADIAAKQIRAQKEFGTTLLTSITATDLSQGITMSPNFLDIVTYTRNIQVFLTVGQLAACLNEIDSLTAAGIPTEYAPFVTADTLATTRAKIASFLGVS